MLNILLTRQTGQGNTFKYTLFINKTGQLTTGDFYTPCLERPDIMQNHLERRYYSTETKNLYLKPKGLGKPIF